MFSDSVHPPALQNALISLYILPVTDMNHAKEASWRASPSQAVNEGEVFKLIFERGPLAPVAGPLRAGLRSPEDDRCFS